MLRSLKDNKLYVGRSDDVITRLNQHNDGCVASTAGRKPFELVYYEACLRKVDAIEREKQLKTGFGRAYLKRRISSI